MIVSITNVYGQSRTKKYNDIMNRYEYYDSSGRMVGYDKWNSIMRQWEYYEANEPAVGTKQVSPYIAPYDVELIERSARYNQERLDRERAVSDAAQEREMNRLIQIINDPNITKGGVCFWTNTGNYGYIDIWVNGLYIGRLTSHFKNGTPEVGQKGTIAYMNRPGTYSLYARSSNNRTWSTTITLKADEYFTYFLK